MDKERKKDTGSCLFNPELAVNILKRSLMSAFGFTEEKLKELDPYVWADHGHRYQLWIINHYIELVKPENPKARFDLIMSTMITNSSANLSLSFSDFKSSMVSAFRHLDIDDVSSFKKEVQKLGFKINQMPPKEGPWSSIR